VRSSWTRRYLLVPAILAVAAASAPASLARREPSPATVVSEPGLDVESVTAIYQDRAGFLWIGSRAGLILYDGYASTLFDHEPSDPASLSDNAIRTVFEDRHGFVWIGTNAGGLDRLDRSAWTFEHHRHDSSDRASLSHDSVYAVVEDRDGKLWVGTQGGLNRLDPTTGRFERFPAGASGPGSDYVAGLHLGRDGELWIATVGGGLSRRDPVSGAFTTFRPEPGDPRSIPADSVFAIAEDGRGALWLATSVGPCWFDPRDGTFRRFPPLDGRDTPPQLASAVVLDDEGAVWVSTWGSGLWRFDAASDRFDRHPLRRGVPGDPAEKIAALHADHQGNVWAGMWGGGLKRVSPGSRRISSITAPPSTGEFQDADITALLEDSRQRLWLGNGRNGLWIPDRDGRPRALLNTSGVPLSLREDPAGDLWIGTGDGLRILDVDRHVLTNVPEASAAGARRDVPPDWVWALFIDRRGRLWVGTGGGGLSLRREDGSFDHFRNDPGDPNSLSDDYVTSIVGDRRGTLWVGTRSGGLNAFDEPAGRWTRYRPDPLDERSLSHHSVTALLEGHDGSLWVGTGGAGINRMERDENTARVAFARFSEKDGLIDDNVVSLAEDSDGTLWIGTRRGLSRFDPKSRTFASYGAEDGLPSADLNVGAVSSGKSRIYFGTHRGAAVVERGTPFVAPRPSPTVLTSIRTPSRGTAGDRRPWETSEIEIPYGQIVSLEFATLDFGDRKRHRYAYRLEPINDSWIDLGSRRDITFTTLDPGTFTLRVRGRNDQGVWSETSRPLSIRVIPPFWMTLWFRLLVAASVTGAAIAVHLARTASLERRNRALLDLKEQRERALDGARTSQQALEEAYRRLRGLTGRLEAAKEEERKWIARELHDEMGTGLTTAKLVLQLLADAPSSEDRDKRIQEAIGLLDRMIGHVRTLSIDLRPPLLDELGLAAALRGYVDSLARRARLEITLATAGLPSPLPEDLGVAAFRVVQEALTNVVRHAEARRVTVDVRYDSGWLEIRVRDDGKGFDVEEALERSSAGAHAGLMGMKERVESMGGELRIRTEAGSGTEVHARLPARS
jgi:signal transduction histidine kinase/ligand-binding sensor domain-containing protein